MKVYRCKIDKFVSGGELMVIFTADLHVSSLVLVCLFLSSGSLPGVSMLAAVMVSSARGDIPLGSCHKTARS